MAASLDRHRDVIRQELHGFGRGRGLTPARIFDTRLFDLVVAPSNWGRDEKALVICRLIEDVSRSLSDSNERAALAVVLNFEGSELDRIGDRQAALATARGCTAEAVRRWWSKGAGSLARAVLDRVDELNRTAGWPGYRASGNRTPSQVDTLDHRFETIESTWWLDDRVARELISFRRLIALADGIDRYEAHASYFSDPREDSCEIQPLLNCEKGGSRYDRRGILVTELVFPNRLEQGEAVFFGYRVVVHSDREAIPIFQHECRAASVDQLIFRLQLDMASDVSAAWQFAVRDDARASTRPTDTQRLLKLSRFGFVEQVFEQAQPGWKYGIALEWAS